MCLLGPRCGCAADVYQQLSPKSRLHCIGKREPNPLQLGKQPLICVIRMALVLLGALGGAALAGFGGWALGGWTGAAIGGLAGGVIGGLAGGALSYPGYQQPYWSPYYQPRYYYQPSYYQPNYYYSAAVPQAYPQYPAQWMPMPAYGYW